MKRIVVRAIALGVVVVLGVIAIAQAQRSNQPGTPPGGPSDAVFEPTGPRVNPLRSGNDRPPADPGMARTTGETAEPPASEPPAKPADPFGRRDPRGTVRQVNNEVPADNPARLSSGPGPIAPPRDSGAADPRAVDPVRPLPSTAPAPPPSVYGGRPSGDRYPQLTDPKAMPGPPPGGDRYGVAHRDGPGSQEPGRLSNDPANSPPTALARPDSRPSSLAAPMGTQNALSPAADQPATLDAASTGEATGQPGAKHLEGPQSPQLTLQKVAPPEVQVGKPAVFRITVRNTGTIPAGNVEVHDQVPRGTRLLGSTPNASRGPRGELTWSLGPMKPGDAATIDVQLMPTAEGEIGSVATVHFDADATARTIATRPKLTVQTTGANRVLLGDPVVLNITISNPGTGVATGVVLEERIPPTLKHPAGEELEYSVGDLKPGESRKLELEMTAQRAGAATNVLTARADASLRTEERFDVEVLAPQLDIAMAGPKRRYLEREATYQLSVANPGTAPAQQVELVAYLPTGLKFVSANNSGQYDESNRAVHWRLDELPVNEKGVVELVTVPIEAGAQNIKIRGVAQKGVVSEKEAPVVIDGIAAVRFQLSQEKNPIEVGGQTTYEVRVNNQGSKAAGNVRMTLVLPPELKPVAAEGPTRNTVDGNSVNFDTLSALAPKAEVAYRVRVQAQRAGDLRVRCQLMTDDMQTPVAKEESTRVYADE